MRSPKLRNLPRWPALYCALISLSYSSPVFAQDDKVNALELIRNNLQQLRLTAIDPENAYVSNTHVDKLSGLRIINLQQRYKGIDIHNALYTMSFKEGKLVSATSRFIHKGISRAGTDKPVIAPAAAVYATARHLNIPSVYTLSQKPIIESGRAVEFEKNGISKNDIPVGLVWVVSGDSALRLAWQVHIDPVGNVDMWNVRIDAINGAVLEQDNWTVHCKWDHDPNWSNSADFRKATRDGTSNKHADKTPASAPITQPGVTAVPLTQNSSYLVIPYPFESPGHMGGVQTVVNNPWTFTGGNTDATTNGWHNDGANDYAYTRGNNVFAQDDLDGRNETPGSVATSSTPFPNLNFNAAFDFTQRPGTSDNLKAAITNLFYWSNIMHDITYQYGFDEASGNFQNDNLGRGGAQNDFVYADVQDGGGVNNANFSVPPDGGNGRMQMYLFDSVTRVSVSAPGNIAGEIKALEGNLSPFNKLAGIGSRTGNIVLFVDSSSTSTACNTAFNAAELQGKIALIDRGGCDFIIKVRNAQSAGAIAVVVANNANGELIIMSGLDSSITIPAAMISQADGNRIRTALQSAPVSLTLLQTLRFDGDLDNGIISHEYAHGISRRLTGGGSNVSCLNNAEQMGEGWSDFYALMVTTDWSSTALTDGAKPRTLGNYVVGSAPTGPGFRVYPYSKDMTINPWTYGMLSNSTSGVNEHRVGEIWCAALWDMTWDIISMDGVINSNLYNANAPGGNTVALKLVTLGLKLQPCRPGFLDGRDAILKADSILYNGRYSCVIWKAFARRGMGVNAVQGSSASIFDQVQNFGIPAGAVLKQVPDKPMAAQGETINYTLNVLCQCEPVSGLTIRDTLPGEVSHQAGGTLNGNELAFSSINLPEQGSALYHFSVKINTGSFSPPVVHLTEAFASTLDSASWKSSAIKGSAQWSVTGTRFNSAGFSLYAPDPAGEAELTATIVNAYPLTRLSTLSFWHFFNTEPNWDGGVLELSVDSGSTWIDAAPFMSSNGYPANIFSNANSSIAGRRSFTGNSGGFIKTVVDLSTFAGKSITFRFRFCSDDAEGLDGWYIDDIELKSESGVRNIAYLYNGNTRLSASSSISFISSLLPVEFTSFSLSKQEEAVMLNWSTSTEFNADRFEVERSSDGLSFHTLGALKAAGNTSSSTRYHFTDKQPFRGINYYRLRQVDIDGKHAYSPIRSALFDQAPPEIAVSPNPSSGSINITLPSAGGNTSMRVFDNKGSMLYNNTLRPGSQTIDLSALGKGSYILHFDSRRKTVVKKLVIQ